ncbi:MAG: tRNA (adenosine(37)-N6)-threonylcarbamoyltransferase complex dimerization subunit type 1 TsaB [Rhodobacteraceae bacterium]|nr:tRNA (adenosine(37)-N6)-threonylcarbamoyltransferase complex dimerization subunit type 1 TsaB [Paracoccaceae bacterium]
MSRSDPLILAFDTSAAHCAAALLCADRIIDTRVEPMTRGQAERLMPMLEAMLARGSVGWRDLSALGVGVGPGNFTGIRVAVAAARGLGLGLGVPVIGVNGFEARALGHPPGTAVCVPAPRGQIYLMGASGPFMAAAEDQTGRFLPQPETADLVRAIARIAAARHQGDGHAPPVPLYVRAADAAPARDLPPVMLDG